MAAYRLWVSGLEAVLAEGSTSAPTASAQAEGLLVRPSIAATNQNVLLTFSPTEAKLASAAPAARPRVVGFRLTLAGRDVRLAAVSAWLGDALRSAGTPLPAIPANNQLETLVMPANPVVAWEPGLQVRVYFDWIGQAELKFRSVRLVALGLDMEDR